MYFDVNPSHSTISRCQRIGIDARKRFVQFTRNSKSSSGATENLLAPLPRGVPGEGPECYFEFVLGPPSPRGSLPPRPTLCYVIVLPGRK